MREVWKPVVGFGDRYLVSNLGDVYSALARRNLKSAPTEGYPTVVLGRGNTRRVCHLVAAAFIGPRPKGLDVCHKNGDRADSRANNLRYGTRGSNNEDLVFHGKRRLSVDDVADIRQRMASRVFGTQAQLAREYGVTATHISHIASRKQYRQLP